MQRGGAVGLGSIHIGASLEQRVNLSRIPRLHGVGKWGSGGGETRIRGNREREYES